MCCVLREGTEHKAFEGTGQRIASQPLSSKHVIFFFFSGKNFCHHQYTMFTSINNSIDQTPTAVSSDDNEIQNTAKQETSEQVETDRAPIETKEDDGGNTETLLSKREEDDQNGNSERVPYKSFKKKYRKLEHRFNQVMASSDELHVQNTQGRKVFNRLVREKARLLELLQSMSAYGNDHLPEKSKIHPVEEDGSSDNKPKLNDIGLHMAQLLDETYEYSSDERSQPTTKNPMGLLEWLKRNQPQVLSEQSFEKPASSTATKKKKTADSNSSTTLTSNTTNAAKSKKRKTSSASTGGDSYGDDEEQQNQHKKFKKQQQSHSIPVQ